VAAKCDICGKITNKYTMRPSGDITCSKECIAAYYLIGYLERLEERRTKDEPNNRKAYEQAREMSAWLSLFRFGNKKYRQLAGLAIMTWYK
jgi:hypothetical protein